MSSLQAAILNTVIGFGLLGCAIFLLLRGFNTAGGFMLVVGTFYTAWYLYHGDKKS